MSSATAGIHCTTSQRLSAVTEDWQGVALCVGGNFSA